MTNTAVVNDANTAEPEKSDRPPLAAVPEPGTSVGVGSAEEVPTLQSFMVRWITIFVVLFTFGTGLPMWAATGSFTDGAALGAFSGFWIGIGYGMLAGGTRWYECTQSH